MHTASSRTSTTTTSKHETPTPNTNIPSTHITLSNSSLPPLPPSLAPTVRLTPCPSSHRVARLLRTRRTPAFFFVRFPVPFLLASFPLSLVARLLSPPCDPSLRYGRQPPLARPVTTNLFIDPRRSARWLQCTAVLFCHYNTPHHTAAHCTSPYCHTHAVWSELHTPLSLMPHSHPPHRTALRLVPHRSYPLRSSLFAIRYIASASFSLPCPSLLLLSLLLVLAGWLAELVGWLCWLLARLVAALVE